MVDKGKTLIDTEIIGWAEDEEQKVLSLIQDDETSKQDIYNAFSGRSEAALDNKIRRLKKENGLYNSPYAAEKYDSNERWARYIDKMIRGPVDIFEGYAGSGNSSQIYDRISRTHIACEIEDGVFDQLEQCSADVTAVNDDCINELHRQNAAGNSFDFIDLDPFGSPFDAIPLSIPLITNGYLAVTYGDIKLQRWGRSNVLMKQYKMPEVTDWDRVAEEMVGYTVFEGIRQRDSKNVRTLTPLAVRNFGAQNGILRVLYRVEKTGVLSDALERYEEQSRNTGQAIPNRPYDLSKLLRDR